MPFCIWIEQAGNGGPCRTTSRAGRPCGALSAPGAYLGTWERLHTTLREQTRLKQGREPTPSAAIIDSQSVKTSQKGGSAATTGAKKCKAGSGTSWWIPLARLLHLLVHAANLQDYDGGKR